MAEPERTNTPPPETDTEQTQRHEHLADALAALDKAVTK